MDLGVLNEKIKFIAEQITMARGLEFVKSEIAGTKRSPVVRVFIDKESGLTVEHCADVSRDIEAKLDELDLIPTKYVLEVSSPGLERELTTLEHFERFSGKLAKLKTKNEIDGAKILVGRINGVADGAVILDRGKAGNITIPFVDIEKANLKIDLDAEFKQRA